ncbi:MAG: UDP-N-acetylmuramoyl-L-alanine--D-glutamate ligase [bacterium]
MNWFEFERFAVWGLGVSGVASANLLARRGKSVVVSDPRSADALASSLEKLHPNVEVHLGSNVVNNAEVVVASPGLKPTLEVFQGLNLPVVSEVEIAHDAASCEFLAITGTDGKTTTTALTAHILESCGRRTTAAGNIGTPLCEVVDDFGAGDYVVAEISAFQLWSTHHFRAHASAFTNIAEDHLDYFPSFEAYVEAKHRLVKFSGAQDVGVFNTTDRHIASWIPTFGGVVKTYGQKGDDFWADDTTIYRASEPWLELSSCRLKGRHNAMNIMAAAQLAHAAGIDFDEMRDAVASFRPLAHRVEPVAEVGGVWFYDDSKATNAHAAMAGIKSLSGPLVVIAGGVDKGLELTQFASMLTERAKAVVLIGEIAPRLADALRAVGHPRVTVEDSLELAVERSHALAAGEGAVVLSPACSSFDMFKSYAHRGEVYQEAVRRLRA